jgi:putative DNA primase/helicase
MTETETKTKHLPPAAPPNRKRVYKSRMCTDYGNAERLIDFHGDDLRYCYAFKSWLVWNGSRWVLDDGAEVMRRAKKTVRTIYTEAAVQENVDLRKMFSQHAVRSESRPRLAAMIDLAQSEPGVAVQPDDLDADRWLLNVKNGTLDLRTGELREHSRAYLCTKLAPVEYDDKATCPEWMCFLLRIFDNDASILAFLRRAVGYSLTGMVNERAFFILYGTGANGKSTFLDVLRYVLGDYAANAEARSLMVKTSSSAANEDIARLRGARFVTASESERGDELATANVKHLSGNDRRTARELYGHLFEYDPTDKWWLATNHKPRITDTAPAIWDRVKLIPFNVRIPEAEQDKKLADKLKAEAAGILHWAVEGCLDWQHADGGLGAPKAVVDATKAYREESDMLTRFVSECCTEDVNASVTLKALYDTYFKWCMDTGERADTKRDFSQTLAERDKYEKYVGTGNRTCFRGIGLVATETPEPTPEPEPLNF